MGCPRCCLVSSLGARCPSPGWRVAEPDSEPRRTSSTQGCCAGRGALPACGWALGRPLSPPIVSLCGSCHTYRVQRLWFGADAAVSAGGGGQEPVASTAAGGAGQAGWAGKAAGMAATLCKGEGRQAAGACPPWRGPQPGVLRSSQGGGRGAAGPFLCASPLPARAEGWIKPCGAALTPVP